MFVDQTSVNFNILCFCLKLLCIQDGWSFPHRTIHRGSDVSTQSQESMSKQVNYTQLGKNTRTYNNLEYNKNDCFLSIERHFTGM